MWHEGGGGSCAPFFSLAHTNPTQIILVLHNNTLNASLSLNLLNRLNNVSGKQIFKEEESVCYVFPDYRPYPLNDGNCIRCYHRSQ